MELWRLDAAALAEGYRSGAFTPAEALDACLARVAECQPHLNAMAHVDRTGARQAAGASRLRWARGKPLGPLDGVPVSLKDNLHAGGLPTTWGSRLLHGFVARRDELPVARLRAAGAVIFGKTTLPEFAMQGYTGNLVTGVTRNPWNTALTPGGSSGGAAASVAAGCGPLALGTDGGGSIRRPASHCGLVGFKPSGGLVAREGGVPEIYLDHEVVGALGRTVGDVAHVMQALASPGLAPAQAAPARILFAPRFGTHPVDAGIAAQAAEAAKRFEAMGHTVEEIQCFDLSEPLNALWSVLSCSGLAWMLGEADHFAEFGLEPGQTPDISQCTQAIQDNLRDGLSGESAAMFELLACMQKLRRALDGVFASHDFILTPAAAALPWAAEQTHPAQIAGHTVGPRGHAVYTAFANAAGLPAMALPAGLVQGLPAGIQLVGRVGADAQLLAMGQQYEQAHPWAGAWPVLPAAAPQPEP
ncbi:MAG: amidase [Ramlibacter sp.]